mmetsp:Transcript_108449/g.346120  ORF Transcript_108449/g.346120 Transcript_108449/m.346120 type:complete len:194 (-) Transcript_108449:14-595(-)
MAEPSARRQRAEALLRRCTASFVDIPLASGHEVLCLQEESRNGGPAVFLIDVRDVAEQTCSMLPGAITAATFERECLARPEEVLRSICIPYCTIGFRSGMYCRRLLSGSLLPAAPVDVRNGEGVVLWSHDVGRFADGAKQLHCYGAEWDVAAEGFSTSVYTRGEQVGALPRFVQSVFSYGMAWLRSLVQRLCC